MCYAGRHQDIGTKPSTLVLTLLDDPEQVFVTTDYVRLEVLPQPLYFRRETEAEFYKAFFAAAECVQVR